MDQIRIFGGRPLVGTITIGGAKNAALPLMAASLLTSEKLRLSNLPDLVDIKTMVYLLEDLGVTVSMDSDSPNRSKVNRTITLTASEPEKKTRIEADIESLEHGIFTGEEGGTERSTPHKDFIASIAVGLIGFLAIIIAIRLSIERSSR